VVAPSRAAPLPETSRLSPIDAMRGVAILLVLVYHCGPNAWRLPPWSESGWLELPSLGWRWLAVPFLHFGFVGVHAFFVLSGFCIHLRAARAIASDEHAPSPSLKRFFLRRFWRIYPPYWIALALFGLAIPLALHHAPASARDLGLHATMLHTFDPDTIFSINPAFWSLATEEQFYLAYPLALYAIREFGIRRVLLISLALSLFWRAGALSLAPVLPPTAENFLTWRVLVHSLFLPRWFEWLLGCFLAELVVDPRRPLTGKARPLSIAAAFFLLAGAATRLHLAADKLFSDAFFSSGFACITGALLAAPPTGIFSRALAALGRRAYGLYLIHQPILDAAGLPALARIILAPIAGILFSLGCERPFERLSKGVR
jgi:peptidoglycan/LPS O-acetylase OafA/YrhL